MGGQLLKVLARTGRRMALKDLARAADMTAAKAHPYLVSFGKLGLIEQDAKSGLPPAIRRVIKRAIKLEIGVGIGAVIG